MAPVFLGFSSSGFIFRCLNDDIFQREIKQAKSYFSLYSAVIGAGHRILCRSPGPYSRNLVQYMETSLTTVHEVQCAVLVTPPVPLAVAATTVLVMPVTVRDQAVMTMSTVLSEVREGGDGHCIFILFTHMSQRQFSVEEFLYDSFTILSGS
jgi:hypothetical protein